jgi:conjugal transfer pilus assembly protein TrbC
MAASLRWCRSLVVLTLALPMAAAPQAPSQAGVPSRPTSTPFPLPAMPAMPPASYPRTALPGDEAMTRAMEEARKRVGGSGREALDAATRRSTGQATASPQSATPRFELKGVPPSPQQRADPLALARQYNDIQPGTGEDTRHNILVFVSLSMPEESLKRIGRDVRAAGGVVVLRGLKHGLVNGTWLKSMEAIKPLASTGAAVQINPELFQQFGVTAVPTTVVTARPVGDKGCGDGSCAAGVGTVVGDVSLEFALDRLSDRRDAVGKIARETATKL